MSGEEIHGRNPQLSPVPWFRLHSALSRYAGSRTIDDELSLSLLDGLVATHTAQDRILSGWHVHPRTRLSSSYRAALQRFASAKLSLERLAGGWKQRNGDLPYGALLTSLRDLQEKIVAARQQLIESWGPTPPAHLTAFEFELGVISLASDDHGVAAWSIRAAAEHSSKLLHNLGVESNPDYSFEWESPETINDISIEAG